MFSQNGCRKISSVLIFALLFSMLVPAMAFGATAVQLKDTSDSYAQKEIQALVDSGIISGYEDGSFQPRKAMSRAELAKIIVLSLGLKENADKASAFKDVDKNSWYRGFVGALVESGITQGTSETTFAPDAKVTREELVVFFVRALSLEEAAGKLAVDAKLSDLKEVSSWAQADVSLAFKIGFVNGIEKSDKSLKFSPKDNAERQALARLAYEFNNNKSKFIDAAKALGATVSSDLAISSVSAVSNTSIEVTFNNAVSTVNKAEFSFDNGLTVTNAELKAGSTTVVVLTTSAQTLDTVYKLSYKGKDTGLTLKGILALFGGGGGGGSSSGPSDRLSDLQKINRGGTFNNDITVFTSGTVGPADGSVTTINGTLTLDPGPNGEITLQNVNAANIVVASGSSNSIKLKNTTIKQLKVAANQALPVRIESLIGANVEKTDIQSNVIIESTAGSLGSITIGSGAAGKDIELRGQITGSVTVTGTGAKIKLAPTQDGKATSIASLILGASATVWSDAKATLTSLSITAPSIIVSLDGPGVITSVTVASTATGTSLTLSLTSNVTGIILNVAITVTDNAGKTVITIGSGVIVNDDLAVQVSKSSLNINYATGDSADSITQNIKLLNFDDINGTNITWSSSNTSVVSNSGAVTRPGASQSDASVILTATISKGTKSITKVFTLTIKKQSSTTPTVTGLVYTSAVNVTTATYQMSLSASFSDGTTSNVTNAATWNSSSTGVATINPSTGLLTVVSNGSTSVTANYGTRSAIYNVTVSVTSVTYVTYNTTASVTGSVYGGNPGLNNGSGSVIHIPAANASNFLIVGFSDTLMSDTTGVTITSSPTATASTYSVVNGTYLAFQQSRVAGAYAITIGGLKRASGSTIPTVTVYVYQD